MRTVFVTNNSHRDHYICINFFKNIGYSILETAQEADIIVFLSSDRRIQHTMYGITSKVKDECDISRLRVDYRLFKSYYGKKLLIGFNTSALFLAVMSGCGIVHRTRIHNELHKINFEKTKGVMSAGYHSQLMYPYNMNPSQYKVLATSDIVCKRELYFKDDRSFFDWDCGFSEPDIVYFEKTNCLCIQSDLYTASLKNTVNTIKNIIECLKQEDITV